MIQEHTVTNAEIGPVIRTFVVRKVLFYKDDTGFCGLMAAVFPDLKAPLVKVVGTFKGIQVSPGDVFTSTLQSQLHRDHGVQNQATNTKKVFSKALEVALENGEIDGVTVQLLERIKSFLGDGLAYQICDKNCLQTVTGIGDKKADLIVASVTRFLNTQ